jgi:hypothetical protein
MIVMGFYFETKSVKLLEAVGAHPGQQDQPMTNFARPPTNDKDP